MSGTSAGFGLKYKGSRDSGTSGSHGSRSHSLLIFQTESGRGSTHLLEFSLIPPIIIYPGEYEKWWSQKFLVKVASLVLTDDLNMAAFVVTTLTKLLMAYLYKRWYQSSYFHWWYQHCVINFRGSLESLEVHSIIFWGRWVEYPPVHMGYLCDLVTGIDCENRVLIELEVAGFRL